MSEGRLTALRILDLRALGAEIEFRGRHSGGTGAALAELVAGRLDVVFGRAELARRQADADDRPASWSASNRSACSCQPAIPLARTTPLPSASLQGLEIDGLPTHDGTRVGGPRTPVLRPVRCALDAAPPAGDRARGAGPSPRPPGRADPRVGRPCRGPRRGPASARGSRSRSTPGRWRGVGATRATGSPRSATRLRSWPRRRVGSTRAWDRDGDRWLPEPDASRLANDELVLVIDGVEAG